MSGFIKNTELLEENYKVRDLLDFTLEVQRLWDAIEDMPYSALIGVVGKFGSGKSTTLYQLQELTDNKTTRWFEFDAWKYPERKDLWEGFVLDIADQLGNKKHTQKKIDGDTSTGKTIGAIAQIAQAVSVMAGLSFVVEKFSHLFEGQPIERVFEIQELLETMFSKLEEKDIFITIEDLDRSGDAGRFFLETLRQFIKTNIHNKRVIILVPIGTEVYDKNEDHRASYHKVFDYVHHFEPQRINFDRFIEESFNFSAFPGEMTTQPNVQRAVPIRLQLQDWFRITLQQGLTIREIKSVLRSANLAHKMLHKQGHNPDPRVTLAFALLNHIHTDSGKRLVTRIRPEMLIYNNSPVFLYLQAIARNVDMHTFSKQGYIARHIRLIDGENCTVPIEETRGENNLLLSDFYLHPF